jgi:hypothetical protein
MQTNVGIFPQCRRYQNDRPTKACGGLSRGKFALMLHEHEIKLIGCCLLCFYYMIKIDKTLNKLKY